MIMRRLRLNKETLRSISNAGLATARGGIAFIAITDGNNGCHSEATGCPSVSEWSCVNFSCTVVMETA